MKRTRIQRKASRDRQEWIAARDAQIAREPYCESCGREATVVHHMRNQGMGYRDHDAENLISLCFWCHHAIHNPRDKDYWRRDR